MNRSVLLLFLLCLPRVLLGSDPTMVDMVNLASAASRSSHRVTYDGGVLSSDSFDVGALRLPVSGVRLKNQAIVRAWLRARDGRTHTACLVLTLATSPAEYGRVQSFRVRINGREAFRIAERDSGGGVSRSVVMEVNGLHRMLGVEVVAEGTDAPITLSSLRWFETERPDSIGARYAREKMGMALLTSQGYGYTLDAPTMRQIDSLQPHSPYLTPEVALVYNFCKRTADENRLEIDRLAGLAVETGIPLRIAFQIHWGGEPVGVPDSAGGTYSDPAYQMIVYDEDDHVDDPGLAALLGAQYDVRFGLSIPNVWSDTPWLTFNNPALNAFRRTRLKDALRAWHAARKRLRAGGKDWLLPPQISTGEETVYWAKGVDDSKYTALNGGKPRSNLMADFNPFTVTAAARDGVVLDPRDGLSMKERVWLHRNLARWQQTLVDWMFDATPPEPFHADDLVRRNIFTEPYALPLYPLRDSTFFHPGLEVGYVLDGRSGGEYWSGAQMILWLQKERERGRIALPNIECTVTDDGQLISSLRAAYAMGSRFITVYNWHPRSNAAHLLKEFADSIDVLPQMAWMPENGSPALLMRRRYTASDAAFGINRVELFPLPGRVMPPSLRLTLRDAGPDGVAEWSVTLDPRIAARGRDGAMATGLPFFFHQQPDRAYDLIVEIPGEGPPAFAAAADGAIAARLSSDLLLERWRSRLIEDWQDVADYFVSLDRHYPGARRSPEAARAISRARALFASGRIGEAYRAAVRAEQVAFGSRRNP